jgi:hypothetical protein
VEKIMGMKNNQQDVSKNDMKDKQSFGESKLTFVEPKLVKHGDVKDITAGGKHGSYYPYP